MVWKPHVTVAAVIEEKGRFLLVEEKTDEGVRFNQPAGHLEESEDFITAVKREVYEETAWQFEPEKVVGVQLWRRQPQATTYVRICFAGRCHDFDPAARLDHGIIAAHWLSLAEIKAKNADNHLRSPLVLRGIEDYLQDRHFPLDRLQSFLDLNL
jgi:8-oxo-dGTP pyrophosphatase MutT (NUDIX family)